MTARLNSTVCLKPPLKGLSSVMSRTGNNCLTPLTTRPRWPRPARACRTGQETQLPPKLWSECAIFQEYHTADVIKLHFQYLPPPNAHPLSVIKKEKKLFVVSKNRVNDRSMHVHGTHLTLLSLSNIAISKNSSTHTLRRVVYNRLCAQ